jgi:hypothetical protein
MPTAPRASPLAQAELALVNAALAHLTSASTTAAAAGEAALEDAAQGGGGALRGAISAWPPWRGKSLGLLSPPAQAARGRFAALPEGLRAKALSCGQGHGAVPLRGGQQGEQQISPYALALATLCGYLWGQGGEFWRSGEGEGGTAAPSLDFQRACLATDFFSRAHPLVLAHAMGLYCCEG